MKQKNQLGRLQLEWRSVFVRAFTTGALHSGLISSIGLTTELIASTLKMQGKLLLSRRQLIHY